MGILDILTGGGLGAIAGLAGGIVTKILEIKAQDKEYAQRALDHDFELKLRDKDREMAAQEASTQLSLHKTDADAQVAVADLAALAASQASDKAAYGDSALGRVVDFLRGVTRPLVTYVAMAYAVYVGVRDPDFRGQCLFIASMAITWWFGTRPGGVADYLRKAKGARS